MNSATNRPPLPDRLALDPASPYYAPAVLFAAAQPPAAPVLKEFRLAATRQAEEAGNPRRTGELGIALLLGAEGARDEARGDREGECLAELLAATGPGTTADAKQLRSEGEVYSQVPVAVR